MIQTISPFAIDQKNQKTYPDTDTPWGKIQFSNTEDFEKKILSKMEAELQAFKNFRANYLDTLWRLCDDAYFGVKKNLNLTDSEKEYRSNIRVRYCYKQVESQTSKIVPSIFNQEPPCSVIPNDDNSETREAKAKGIQKILQYYMMQKQNGLSLIYKWIKQGERYGLSPLKLSWAYEKGKRIRRTPVLDKGGKVVGIQRVESEDDAIVKDNPECFNVSTKRVWWNPDATDPDTDLRVVYERCIVPLNYIKNSDLYMNTDKLVPSVVTENDDTSSRDGADKYTLPTETDMCELYERWDKNTLIVMCQGRIIRYRDNPFDEGIIPYFFYRSTPVDNEFVGLGTIEPSLDLEALANTIHNQRIDNVNRIIHKMIFVGSMAGWKANRRLRFRPGGIEQMADITQVREFQMTDVTASSYIEVDKAAGLMDDIGGDPEIGRGETGPSRESATSVTLRTQGASYRIELKTLFAQLELGRLYRSMYCLERQFGDPTKWVSVLGANEVEYLFARGELFVSEYEYDYTLNGYTGNRLIDFQQFMQGVQALGAVGLIGELDPKEIVKVFTERTNMRGADRLLRKPELVSDGYFRDPYEENKRMVYYGEQIGVLPGEQHGRHIPIHQKLLDTPGLPEAMKAVVFDHQKQHIAMFVADKQAKLQMQAQVGAQNRMVAQAAEGAVPDQGMAYNQAAGEGGLTVGGANNVRR